MDLPANSVLLVGVAASTWIKPLWMVALAMLGATAVLAGTAAALRWGFPKVAAIAWTTAKEALSQPLFYVLLAFGTLALLVFPFIPFNTLGEDVKMLKDSSLTLIMVLSIILALWTASISVAEEIEGRVALTLLSKPIGRRQFIFGKFLGILGPVAVMFIVLGALFLATVSYKVVFEARENGLPDPTWRDCLKEVVLIMPGLVLTFMEVIVLTAVSVAISTRLPMIPNLVICAAIYVLGHLMPALVAAASKRFEIPYFVAQLLAAVLPMLDYFNPSTAVTTGRQVPLEYLGWAGLYCLLYTSVAMLLALLLFEDRDLA
jgi:ABC-type transport system involved in multi-copper enzyme maturation permease subunit